MAGAWLVFRPRLLMHDADSFFHHLSERHVWPSLRRLMDYSAITMFWVISGLTVTRPGPEFSLSEWDLRGLLASLQYGIRV